MRAACYVLTVLFFASCEETILLDLNQTTPRVVIEGLVTDVPGLNYVKVSRSADFYQTGSTVRVIDAVVTVIDNLGTVTFFTHNPSGKNDSSGYYLPPFSFKGELDKTYSMNVVVDGITYSASDELRSSLPIDSLEYRVNDFEMADPDVQGRYYELLFYAKEPQVTKDYYLFKYYRNDTLALNNSTDIYIGDDQFIGEEINGVPSPVYFAANDTAVCQIHALSRTGFLYYSDMLNILNNDGGMFSPPPANPRSNISNGALGFFQVSGVTITGTIIQE